jgi:hypothetical protein
MRDADAVAHLDPASHAYPDTVTHADAHTTGYGMAEDSTRG